METKNKTEGGNWGSSIFFIANLLNFVLATAVFTIPFPMHEVGILLGTIILALTCFISVIACTFIIEALALKNSLLKKEKSILNKAIQENEQGKKDEEKNPKKDKEEKDKDRPTFLSKDTLNLNLDIDIKKEEEIKKEDIINNVVDNNDNRITEEKEGLIDIKHEEEDESDERNDSFYIYRRYEI